MDAQVFLDYVVSKYGDQVFRVPVEQIAEVLVDLQLQLDILELKYPIPIAVADELGVEVYDGDVELLIYPSTMGDFTVAVFPIYSEE